MSDCLTVTIWICSPRPLSSNSRSHWRTKARAVGQFRDAAFEATCLALDIPAWQTSGGWRQGAYTPPDWLRPAYAEMDRRESNRLPAGQRQRGSWRPLPELLVLDVLIVWKAGQQRLDDLNAPTSIKNAVDGMCNAIALNDRLIRLGQVRQERATKQNPADWQHGRTVLTLRAMSEHEIREAA